MTIMDLIDLRMDTLLMTLQTILVTSLMLTINAAWTLARSFTSFSLYNQCPAELNLAESTNVIKTGGNMVMLPYVDVPIVTQPYASRVENVNPFNVFTFIGRVDLTPASDDWIDIERKPARIENVEGDFSAVARGFTGRPKWFCSYSVGWLED